MADELKHKDIGTQLTKAEFEDVTLHQLDSQATGDLIKAISDTQLSRLPIGANDKVLTVVSGVPAWADVPAATLAEDVLGSEISTINTGTNAEGQCQYDTITLNADESSAVLATKTLTFDASSMAVGFGGYCGWATNVAVVIELFMGGVEVAQTACTTGQASYNITRVLGTKALSGVQTVYIIGHNEGGASYYLRPTRGASGVWRAVVGAGSIKAV